MNNTTINSHFKNNSESEKERLFNRIVIRTINSMLKNRNQLLEVLQSEKSKFIKN